MSTEIPKELKPTQVIEKTPDQIMREKEAEAVKEFFNVDAKTLERRMELIQRILDIVRGVRDIKGRLSPIMEPTGISLESSARLSKPQAEGLAEIKTLSTLFKFFEPVEELGNHRAWCSISENGEGRKEAISLTGAQSGTSLLKDVMSLSLSPSSELQRKKAEKKGWFR